MRRQPRPEWRESARYWEEHSATIRRMFAPLTAALVAEAGIVQGQSVLDVAGGPGEDGGVVPVGEAGVGVDVGEDVLDIGFVVLDECWIGEEGVVGFLPILGFWMLPLGALLLAEDLPFLRKPTLRALGAVQQWWDRRRGRAGGP